MNIDGRELRVKLTGQRGFSGRLSLLGLMCVLSSDLMRGAAANLPAIEAAIQARSTNQFAAAILFKPAEMLANELAFRLAPLIIQQVAGGDHSTKTPDDRFGRLELADNPAAFDPSSAVVYYYADAVELAGKTDARIAYLWFYPPKRLTKRHPRLPFQGVRLTLDSSGQPAVWEVLADTSGAQVLFVSKSLELAAMKEFGSPPPARKYAVELPRSQTADVVVARIVEDGPVPMGPMVYLSADTRDVSSIACRCMPAQAKTLRETSTYTLVPFQNDTASLAADKARLLIKRSPAFWPAEELTGPRLARCLRLPGTF